MSDDTSGAETTEEISDYDELINILLPVATEALEEHGDFSPTAAFVQSDGQLCNLGIEFEDGEPSPDEIVEALQNGLKEQVAEREARATGVCSIVVARLEENETEAICVNLEQKDGDPMNVFLPYRIEEDAFEYGELVAGHGQSIIFA